MPKLDEDRIQHIRETIRAKKDAIGGSIIKLTVYNDRDVIRHFLDNEKELLFSGRHVKNEDQYSRYQNFMKMLYEIFGAIFKAKYEVHDINALDQHGYAPLHHICSSKIMLEEVVTRFNPDLNVKNRFGDTPIIAAAECEAYDSVKYFY